MLERATAEAVQRLHHNAQRLLRPLAVVNPYVEQLTYPSDRLMHRREQKKYLALSADLLRMIEKLEAARLAMRKNGDEAWAAEVERRQPRNRKWNSFFIAWTRTLTKPKAEFE